MTANELTGHFINRRGFVTADRRTDQRNPAFKFGVIACDPDRRILSVVKNISSTGALIEVDNALEISDEFTLAIESESSARICRVAWKNAKQIAVNFKGTQREPPQQPVESRQSGRQERRFSPRRSLNATAWIRMERSFALRECTIIDLSLTGVRIAIPFAGKIPQTFTVLFSKHAAGHRARMIWRRANQIGAKFI
jgi:PilZ domain